MTIHVQSVRARYLGEQRAEIRSESREFIVDQRVNVGREGARFCPVELITASLAS